MESQLLINKHILLCLDNFENTELEYLKKHFCGTFMSEVNNDISNDQIIYMCGNINQTYDKIKHLHNNRIYVIKELSNNYTICSEYNIITLGQVPININNVGVMFRQLFVNPDKNYFESIKSEHTFQSLTESNKQDMALRKGIYLTDVTEDENGLHYKLLRCSSNLNGPTDNFRTTDREILNILNNVSKHFFDQNTEFNHVLAQVYENTDQGKAKIKAHSDKTKDMPRNGLMAFCTFYDSVMNGNTKKIKQSKVNMFDYCYNDTSVLTKLHFRLKASVTDPNLVREFDVILYPNSVFIMSLWANRLYTHDIRPSALPADKIPTRMGYVVRCSKTNAVYKDGQTYISDKNGLTHMRKMTDDDIEDIRKLYFNENITDHFVEYGNVYYSMNGGDYMKPNI